MPAKRPCISFNLPNLARPEPLGFGIDLPFSASLPRYLTTEVQLTESDEVSFQGTEHPLLNDEVRQRLGKIARSNDDFLLKLGTRNSISRILMACACDNLVVTATADRRWIAVRADLNEMLSLAAPTIFAFDAALERTRVDPATIEMCLAAVARYFAFEPFDGGMTARSIRPEI